MGNLLMVAEVTQDTNALKDFVNSVTGAVTTNISLTQVAAVMAAIIGVGIVAIFAWKFARKGYNFVKNALSGRGGKI